MPSHRAESRTSLRRADAASTPGGRHASPRRAGSRRAGLGWLPPAPTVAGVVVLAAATAGALGTGTGSAVSAPLRAAGLSTHSAAGQARHGTTLAVSAAALRGRERAVSRDSQREARADAADQHLQRATEQQARERNAALAKLAAGAEKQAGLIARNTWQLPVTKGVYHLTAGFGSCSGLWSHCHTGLDFAAPTGTPIHAVASGTITETSWAGAYGNRTVETLSDGTELWYAHQSAFGVTKGQKVRAGQVIGKVGATGNVTGPHVHLEVRPGGKDPVDPYKALTARGLKP